MNKDELQDRGRQLSSLLALGKSFPHTLPYLEGPSFSSNPFPVLLGERGGKGIARRRLCSHLPFGFQAFVRFSLEGRLFIGRRDKALIRKLN